MSAFKHSAVSFGTPDMPPPDVGSTIGPISLHNALSHPNGFRERFEAALEDAKPWIELERAEAEAASREAWERCQELAEEPDILGRFAVELARSGVAGESKVSPKAIESSRDVPLITQPPR